MEQEKESTTIVIDGNEHIYEDMTDEQKVLIEHISDLDHKTRKAQRTLDQLAVSRSGFVTMLTDSLAET